MGGLSWLLLQCRGQAEKDIKTSLKWLPGDFTRVCEGVTVHNTHQ